MKGRESKQVVLRKTPITVKDIHGKKPDRLHYIKDKFFHLASYFSNKFSEIYTPLEDTFNFRRVIWPTITSGLAYVIGNYVTAQMSRATHDTDEYDYVFKLLIGTALLGYSITQRISDKKIQSTAKLSAAAASEALSIAYLYESTFRVSRLFLSLAHIPNEVALIASLSTSAITFPGAISYAAKKYQEFAVKKEYAKGAQRSDTATLSSGMTPVTNTYLQINHSLMKEMIHKSRVFQAGLIGFNILDEKNSFAQGKNVPALVTDVAFPIYDAFREQQNRLKKDYEFNTAPHNVLQFKEGKPVFISKQRAQLRTGDLVYCDNHFNTASSPISGEIIALKKDEKGEFENTLVTEKYSINLKAKNGEDIFYQRKTETKLNNEFKKIDLQAVRSGKQSGVLSASRLELFGKNNFFVSIKEENERTSTNDYEKTAVISDYIMQCKNKNVNFAGALSLASALLVNRDPLAAPRWIFKVFQMMIPFSESFTRNKVNEILLKEINQNLPEHNSMHVIDALRIVDFWYAISGHYRDRFPQGVAIVSDKTGTLTTSGMDVLGCWTDEMNADVQNSLKDEKSSRLPNKQRCQMIYEVFASAYTNHKKESEPEENAIRQFLSTRLNDFKVEPQGNSHFKKSLFCENKEKIIETFHLGLYTKLGGRLTLVADEKQRYLVFCGVPRGDQFQNSSLLKSYQNMQARVGVLSRDWCVARSEMNEQDFLNLKTLFFSEKQSEIEAYLRANRDLTDTMIHYGTFIVNNPIKKGAEKFISQCASLSIPVFIATGDSAKAAENIARVLCPAESKLISIIDKENVPALLDKDIFSQSTIIFAGLNKAILCYFDKLMSLDQEMRPVIIFSEMSTANKGSLAKHLKDRGYFIVANGDGTNDIAMMRHAHTVFAHLADDGNYSAGVEQFANLNDKQLQLIRHSDQSFYELFDIDKTHSHFAQSFARLANSQIKPFMGLSLKSSKIGWSLFKELGFSNVKDPSYMHPKGIAFDLAWVGLTVEGILATADQPADDKNPAESDYSTISILASLSSALLQASVAYAFCGESVNENWMLAILAFYAIALRCIFTSYGQTHNEANTGVRIEEITDSEAESVPLEKACSTFSLN